MYDDYEIESFNKEFYAYELDEMVEYHMQSYDIQDSYDSDDDYERDSCDYD